MTMTKIIANCRHLTEKTPRHKLLAPDKAENYSTERKGEKNRESDTEKKGRRKGWLSDKDFCSVTL